MKFRLEVICVTDEGAEQRRDVMEMERHQYRLHKRYRSLAARGKNPQKVVTAVGRELLGFIWAIGNQVESNSRHRTATAA